MNYYEKLLLESNVGLYNDRYNMAIGILESYGIEISEDSILESYGLSFLLETSDNDDLDADDVKKLKDGVVKMKSNGDIKGLTSACRSMIPKSKQSKAGADCFVFAFGNLCSLLKSVGFGKGLNPMTTAGLLDTERQSSLQQRHLQQIQQLQQQQIQQQQLADITRNANQLANDQMNRDIINHQQQMQLQHNVQMMQPHMPM